MADCLREQGLLVFLLCLRLASYLAICGRRLIGRRLIEFRGPCVDQFLGVCRWCAFVPSSPSADSATSLTVISWVSTPSLVAESVPVSSSGTCSAIGGVLWTVDSSSLYGVGIGSATTGAVAVVTVVIDADTTPIVSDVLVGAMVSAVGHMM